MLDKNENVTNKKSYMAISRKGNIQYTYVAMNLKLGPGKAYLVQARLGLWANFEEFTRVFPNKNDGKIPHTNNSFDHDLINQSSLWFRYLEKLILRRAAKKSKCYLVMVISSFYTWFATTNYYYNENYDQKFPDNRPYVNKLKSNLAF